MLEETSRLEEDGKKKSVLLLGMVYAHHAQTPKRGQEFRDRVRCEAVENLGFRVYTLDNKHDGEESAEHCRANFTESRRMIKAMQAKWVENPVFDHIILDYFFSPIGWARVHWRLSFFKDTLPALIRENFLSAHCQIWLPHVEPIDLCLEEASETIHSLFTVRLVSLADSLVEHPLCRATNGREVGEALLACPEPFTHDTQLRLLLAHSAWPFYVLERREERRLR